MCPIQLCFRMDRNINKFGNEMKKKNTKLKMAKYSTGINECLIFTRVIANNNRQILFNFMIVTIIM